jgi:uroporphyrinogen decarboxylase
MNSLERVLAAMQGKPADRRPVSLTLSLVGAALTHCPLQTYYTDAAAYARGQSAVRHTFQPDILFGPFSLPLEGKAFGSEIRFFDHYVPNLLRPAVPSVKELAKLIPPDPDSHPVAVYFREAVRQMVKEHGRDVPVAAITLNPVDLPAMILGVEEWLETLLFDPDNTRRMLDITVPYFVSRVNALFKEGAAVVIVSTGFCNAAVVTRQMAETFALPSLKEAFAAVDGPLAVHSTGTELVPFIDLFEGLPNVAAFVIDGRDRFEMARQKCGNRATIIGNIDGPGLRDGKPEEIREACRDILTASRNDPHFILGTSGPDVPFDTPAENIHAVREAAVSFSLG